MLISNMMKKLIDNIAKALPDLLYFKLMPKLHILGSEVNRKGGTAFSIVGKNLYAAESLHSDNGRIYFCERTRYHRYLYSEGPNRTHDVMLAKYFIERPEVFRDGVVIDVGANVGEFVGAVAPYARRVIAFEPDPAVQEALELNASQFSNVEVLPVALSNANGHLDFYLSTQNADSSFVRPQSSWTTCRVDTLTLDQALLRLGIKEICLLKLEAEGWEPEVLKGGVRALAVTKKICVDAGPERHGESTREDVERLLLRQGFRTAVIGNIVLGDR